MKPIRLENIITQSIQLPLFSENKINVDVLRLDQVHEFISGNKWFKLRYHLEELKKTGQILLTFGGAWSNHLLAAAAAGQLNNIPVVGMVRGERPAKPSPILKQCEELGMELVYISREDYRKKRIPPRYNTSSYYIIPEGGFGNKGMQGAATIPDFFSTNNYTHIGLAAGTGTTAAGLLRATKENTRVIAISVLKNHLELEKNILSLAMTGGGRLQVHHDYSFGGYADHTPELIRFMNELYTMGGIPTDFVYTGKLFFAVNDLIQKNYFPAHSKILIIHSGGLKGNTSLSNGTLIF